MKKIRDFSDRSPILFSLAFTVLVLLVHEAFANFFYLFPDTVWLNIIGEVAFIICPIVLVVIFGHRFIFRQKGFRATFGAALPSFLLFGLVLVGEILSMVNDPATEWKSAPEILLGILMLIGVGFREEILYRGVIVNTIARKYANSKKGLWITVLSANAMFGAMHIANVFHGVTLRGYLIQTLTAFGGGIYFCVVYLRGGSIWAVALLHTLLNSASAAGALITNGAGDLNSIIDGIGLQEVIYIAFDFLLAAFLMRKSKRQQIIDRVQLNASEAGKL